MSTLTFNTLAYSKKLQKAGIAREQADAIADAQADAMKEMSDAQELVTKKDLAIALADTKHDILKWMVTAMIAQTALLVGIIAFLR